MTTEGIYDDLLESLKTTNDRIVGAHRIIKATPPERLNVTLLTELRELVADAGEDADSVFVSLLNAVKGSPRQTHVRDFTGPVTTNVPPAFYSEEADRVR